MTELLFSINSFTLSIDSDSDISDLRSLSNQWLWHGELTDTQLNNFNWLDPIHLTFKSELNAITISAQNDMGCEILREKQFFLVLSFLNDWIPLLPGSLGKSEFLHLLEWVTNPNFKLTDSNWVTFQSDFSRFKDLIALNEVNNVKKRLLKGDEVEIIEFLFWASIAETYPFS